MTSPYKLDRISKRFIIDKTYSDSLAKLNGLLIGDIVLSINNIKIDKLFNERQKFTGGSNESGIERNILFDITCSSQADTATIVVERNFDTIECFVQRYHLYYLNQFEQKDEAKIF